MTSSRHIMVCGGAGFIGSHLVDRLLVEGHEVDVVDDLSTGSFTNLSESRSGSGRLKFQNISVTSAEFSELVSLRRPSVIVNLAAFTPSQMHLAGASNSLAITIAVLEAARRGAVSKVVTAIPARLVYGEVAARDLPIKEGHINDARTTEEVLGRAATDMHHVYRDRHGVEFTVLAMGNVYGKRQRTQDGVIASFLDALAQGKAPIVHGSGKQVRDFVFIDDTVDAISRSLDRAGGLVINVGTGVSTTINDLWSVMGGLAAPVPRSAAERPHDIARLSLSPVRARIQLGWSPFTTLEQGLASLR
jgi:UDP-glucose 4-epimerase